MFDVIFRLVFVFSSSAFLFAACGLFFRQLFFLISIPYVLKMKRGFFSRAILKSETSSTN